MPARSEGVTVLAWLKALVRTLNRWIDWAVAAALSHGDSEKEPPVNCGGIFFALGPPVSRGRGGRQRSGCGTVIGRS
jgi:hypothetical protein